MQGSHSTAVRPRDVHRAGLDATKTVYRHFVGPNEAMINRDRIADLRRSRSVSESANTVGSVLGHLYRSCGAITRWAMANTTIGVGDVGDIDVVRVRRAAMPAVYRHIEAEARRFGAWLAEDAIHALEQRGRVRGRADPAGRRTQRRRSLRARRGAPDARRRSVMKAMVIDDSRAMRAMLRKMVEELGYEVVEAEHGADALDLLGGILTEDVAFALVDWNMPVMDGLEFVKAVRADRQWDRLRLMMVTSETSPRLVYEALKAGVDEYAMKPVTREIIREKLGILGIERSA